MSPTHVRDVCRRQCIQIPATPSSRPDTVLHSAGIHLGRRVVTPLQYGSPRLHGGTPRNDRPLPSYGPLRFGEDRYRAEQAAQSVARIKFYRIQNMNKTEWERVEDKKKNRALSRAATSSRPHSAAPSLFRPPSRVSRLRLERVNRYLRLSVYHFHSTT